ncbi:CPBP family intramembrane glutamic endopeptidase [Stackebrandtia albiflava]|nr:CPBP family intramembrane glutamic endopeptidase [Stackebrandtia albiflava]
METTHKPHGIVGRLLADRHSLPLSIALHLVPGLLIVAAYFVIGVPVVDAVGYPTFLAWAIALVVVLYPLLLGLMWLGRRQTGRFGLRGVLKYTDRPLSRGRVIAMGVPLLLWMLIVASAVTPPIDEFLFGFFTWLPYADIGEDPMTYLEGNGRDTMVTTLLISLPFTGVTLPLIEEIYFRGFLMPRLAHLRVGAPILSTVLFSVYHFWSPWVVVSRLIFTFPGFLLAWRYRDIRLSIWMHVGTTALMGGLGPIAIMTGVL